MNWYLNNKLVHTHTTLVNSHEHTVTFNKRLVVPGPYLVDVQRYGLLEAHLRNTDMRASATLSLLVTKLRRDLPCNQTTKNHCLPLNAVCGNYSSGGAGSCQCETNVTRWSRETGSCRKLCSTPKDCEPLGPGARCDALLRPAVCECGFPYVYESHRCQRPECVTAQQCRLKHGLRSFCQQGMCACLAGHVLSAGRCEPVLCLSDEECSEPHMRCLGGVCVCDLDYDLLENECRKSAAVHEGTLGVRPEDVPLRDRLPCGPSCRRPVLPARLLRAHRRLQRQSGRLHEPHVHVPGPTLARQQRLSRHRSVRHCHRHPVHADARVRNAGYRLQSRCIFGGDRHLLQEEGEGLSHTKRIGT
ncbi:unnamed protein product [Ixodes persulcatus]